MLDDMKMNVSNMSFGKKKSKQQAKRGKKNKEWYGKNEE